MNIIVISHEYPPIGGGGANACLNLTKEYIEKGNNVDIITTWFEGLSEFEEKNIGSGILRIYRLKSRRAHLEHCSFKEMLDYLIKAFSFSKKLVNEKEAIGQKYDVCQIFFGIPSGPVGLYLKRRYKIPYVIRFGGGDIPGFQDRFSFVYKVIGPCVKIIWRNADALVANSEGLKFLAYDFCDKYPVKVIPNGVDTAYYYPNENGILIGDEVVLLFISRLIERKGLQYIIPSLNKIEEQSSRKIKLLIVGDGPYRSELESLSEKYGARDKIEFVGQKNKDELLQYYQQGDLFVFPSKKEGMPNAVLEAMACGLPVVMSPCQGSKELINGNGIVANSDLECFDEYIIKLLQSSDENIKRMAAISRKRAENEFSWSNVADEYLKIFKENICQK
ncbi:Glycosyltransferase involved in cell wall bisynthesis [Pseudobutyrivibrio sp. UC1225]|uniref:glycosyltransferase family 4 protein n=1 Tax=Pseudobutyrivibrio sp. UC1225 TaxID=1798185 RepID=UPI0008F05F35|nr:glycosyltransferase family 4 protein [Pseudobutyrivibrio sp. UC1225]SFO22016.1 Glycosyltransferase involved in cell wall bisynthesis [Pseudobutyrivibrio sp. UC1225]